MILRYDTEKLQKMVNDFHAVTGISVSVLDANAILSDALKNPILSASLFKAPSRDGQGVSLPTDVCFAARNAKSKP